MPKNLRDITLLQCNHTGLYNIYSLVLIRQLRSILKAVLLSELTGNIQLEINIDTMFFELGKEVIEAF